MKAKQQGKTIHSWKGSRPLLERWRKSLTPLTVELKQPRLTDAIAIDFGSGEPVEHTGAPTAKFKGQLIYYTSADLTIRRLSGAILVVDRYELIAISDRKTRLEPH